MRIAIVGIGALGCLLGARLNEAADLIMVGHWPEQITAIAKHGLWLEHPDGHRTHHHPQITGDLLDVGHVDLALVVVKSRQTREAASVIATILKPDGLAITLQNGINNCFTLRSVLGEGRVSQGLTSEGATLLRPGDVRHAGHGMTFINQGDPLGAAQKSKVLATADLFNNAGLKTEPIDDTDALLWGKLAVNAAINPLTALLRVRNGFLAERAELLAIMSRIECEVKDVARAQGIELPEQDNGYNAAAVARATGSNYSSMLQDVMQGRPTEIEFICGAVSRIGHEHRISTPYNARLYQLVTLIDKEGASPIEPGDVIGLIKLLEQ